MNTNDYQWHYDYVRLACDSGFSFHALKSQTLLDVGYLDIERLTRERDLATIERYIGTVVEFKIDTEQTRILDPKFVKIFQLGQLAVQYLLFCKKYLDNTVVLLKNDFLKNIEETKNLKRFVEELRVENSNAKKQIKDLKSALNCQIASTQSLPVFQCNECTKAFSTEEYLLGHIKRRHESNNDVDVKKTSFQVETDKLQLEIKELKERLNNTEKFIRSDDLDLQTKRASSVNSSLQNVVVENTKLTELQSKFELMKGHVENELRILQTQKFDQEKYEKWFETFLMQLDRTHNRSVLHKNQEDNLQSKEFICNKCCKQDDSNVTIKNAVLPVYVKNDSTTQTDALSPPNPVGSKTYQDESSQTNPAKKKMEVRIDENKENKIAMEADNRLEKFEEIIHEKVSGSMEKLENKMQSFINKMNDIEKQTIQNKNMIEIETKSVPKKSEITIETLYVTPDNVEPKRKKPIPLSKQHFQSNILPTELEVETVTKQATKKFMNVTQAKSKTNLSNKRPNMEKNLQLLKKVSSKKSISNSDSESEASDEDSSSNESSEGEDDIPVLKNLPLRSDPIVKSSIVSTLGKRSLTSLKEVAFTPEVLNGLQQEIEFILNNRLEELGVSPDWSSLPMRSYQRAMNIVNHQATLIQKNISNYMQIRNRILKDVDKKAVNKSDSVTPKRSKLRILLSKAKPVSKHVAKLNNKNLKPKESSFEKNSQKVKLKPMPMYGTDSETESIIKNNKSSHTEVKNQTKAIYGDVIQELNTTISSKVTAVQESPKNVVTEIVESNPDNVINKNITDVQSKGVLKSFPSIGCLQKKKVIFDLESSDTSMVKEPEKDNVHDGGSTTSIASSILDVPKLNEPKKKNQGEVQNLSDVSDWEISETINY